MAPDWRVADWEYLAEGASHIVLKHTGSDPYFRNQVLRILKRPVDWDPSLTEPLKVKFRHSFEHMEMADLLGAEYIAAGTLVEVPSHFLVELGDRVQPMRSPFRLCTEVDVAVQHAVLLPDLRSLDGVEDVDVTYMVEIKPKWGILPSRANLSEKTAVKATTCRYCMHQVYKSKSPYKNAATRYCPLNLYSGCHKRRCHAICALVSHPANNLRVTRNGTLVWPSENEDPSEFLQLFSDDLSVSCDKALEAFAAMVSEALGRTPVLERLVAAQKRDAWDIETVAKIYAAMQKTDSEAVRHLPPPSEWNKIVSDYCLAATAKDCSLLLTFALPRSSSSSSSSEKLLPPPSVLTYTPQHSCQQVWASVKVIDLDLKPVHRIPAQYTLDQSIVQCFTSFYPPGASDVFDCLSGPV